MLQRGRETWRKERRETVRERNLWEEERPELVVSSFIHILSLKFFKISYIELDIAIIEF